MFFKHCDLEMSLNYTVSPIAVVGFHIHSPICVRGDDQALVVGQRTPVTTQIDRWNANEVRLRTRYTSDYGSWRIFSFGCEFMPWFTPLLTVYCSVVLRVLSFFVFLKVEPAGLDSVYVDVKLLVPLLKSVFILETSLALLLTLRKCRLYVFLWHETVLVRLFDKDCLLFGGMRRAPMVGSGEQASLSPPGVN